MKFNGEEKNMMSVIKLSNDPAVLGQTNDLPRRYIRLYTSDEEENLQPGDPVYISEKPTKESFGKIKKLKIK